MTYKNYESASKHAKQGTGASPTSEYSFGKENEITVENALEIFGCPPGKTSLLLKVISELERDRS